MRIVISNNYYDLLHYQLLEVFIQQELITSLLVLVYVRIYASPMRMIQ